MPAQPVVVLHDGRLPPATAMGRVTARAELFADDVPRRVEGRPLRHIVDTSLGHVPSTGSRP